LVSEPSFHIVTSGTTPEQIKKMVINTANKSYYSCCDCNLFMSYREIVNIANHFSDSILGQDMIKGNSGETTDSKNAKS